MIVRPQIPTVSVDELTADATLVDVREDEEWAAGHIEGAVHIPMNSVPQHVQYGSTLTPDAPLVVLCKMGGRSAQVTAWLREQGFDAVNLDGGMLAWARAGRAMVSDDGQPARIV